MNSYKQEVAHRFSSAALNYHTYASIQRACAKDLVSHLQAYCDRLPDGSILEIGCGTGFVTQELVKQVRDRPLHITDLSSTMMEFCQNHLCLPDGHSHSISFAVMDGEAVVNGPYAAIIGGFVVQWFVDPILSLQKLVEALAPGGVLLASFPTHDSFPEWRQLCDQLQLPCTANPLPDPNQVCASLTNSQVKCRWDGRTMGTTHSDAAAFFKSLKLVGAGLGRSPWRLSQSQMKQLIQVWNQQSAGIIQVQYHIALLTIQRC